MNITLLRRTCAELVGTYALVTAGCGAVMVDAQTHALGHVGIALTFGLVVLVMVASIGYISGAMCWHTWWDRSLERYSAH